MSNNKTNNTVTGQAREIDFAQYFGQENRVMLSDSYKYSHAFQYPSDTQSMYDYAEARSGGVYDVTLFNGLQPLLKTFFSTPIKQWEVDEAYMYAQSHGVSFDIEGWDYIVQTLDGWIPVEIKAIPEGSIVPVKIPLFTVESFDKKVFWVASWLETILMTVWYPSNIGTRSYFVRKMLEEYADLTQDNPFVAYSLHNFGMRGSSTLESGKRGALGHLAAGFYGSDNFAAIREATYLYNVKDINTIMHSINASEHSSTSAWTREGEMDMIFNHLVKNKGQAIIAAVMDTYDYFAAVKNVCDQNGRFQKLINAPEYPIFVMRPDSGNPADIIPKTLDIMEELNVPFTINSKGYKVFNKMRIIWGDGITQDTMKIMLDIMIARGYSSENIAFGSGGWLMQLHDRDTMGWALKCSSISIDKGHEIDNGEDSMWISNIVDVDVYKDPITAPNKVSKKGKVTTYIREDGAYFAGVLGQPLEEGTRNALETVFKNGKMVKEYTLEEVRANNARKNV